MSSPTPNANLNRRLTASSISTTPMKSTSLHNHKSIKFGFHSLVYRISPVPDYSLALSITLQGKFRQTSVALMILDHAPEFTQIAAVKWKSPYVGFEPEWQRTFLDQVWSLATPFVVTSRLINGYQAKP